MGVDQTQPWAPVVSWDDEAARMHELMVTTVRRQREAQYRREARRRDRDAAQSFCLRLVDALGIAGSVLVVGNPVRILMPADPNPFPRITLFGGRR